MVSATLPVGSPGSSPLTRGKHPKQGALFLVLGLIPAHTGKTSSSSCITGLSPAQPHSHGENKQLLVAAASQRGSSPLTRGKLRQRPPTAPISRLIPAHAGKTVAGSIPALGAGAHPRSRGENLTPAGVFVIQGGSSPLTRGKLRDVVSPDAGLRLIPAHAGNRQIASNAKLARDSSPLTRGKRTPRGLDSAGNRLIPVHAGKTRPGIT